MMANPLQNLIDAEANLRQRGIAARVEYPGNLFVDLADGSMWGFTSHLNREDGLIETYFYPDHRSVRDLESFGEQPPINLTGEADGERIAAEIAARILSHFAPATLLDRGLELCADQDCDSALCPACDDHALCCLCQNDKAE